MTPTQYRKRAILSLYVYREKGAHKFQIFEERRIGVSLPTLIHFICSKKFALTYRKLNYDGMKIPPTFLGEYNESITVPR